MLATNELLLVDQYWGVVDILPLKDGPVSPAPPSLSKPQVPAIKNT